MADRFNISTLRPSRPKALLFGIDNICLKTKSSLTGGIIKLVSLFILLSTKLEIISTDVGGKLDFLTGAYLSAICLSASLGPKGLNKQEHCSINRLCMWKSEHTFGNDKQSLLLRTSD